jgi:AcrR family transcriptional regulator
VTRLTRKEKQARTRACLLAAAERIFARRGLERASVDEVAEDAGFTKGAFYANFKSKEELFLVMLDEKFAAEIERLDRALQGGADPREQARAAGVEFIRFVRADPDWLRLYFEFVSYAARNEDFREELQTRYAALRGRMVELLRRWSADFPAEPPYSYEEIVSMMFCMADGFFVQQQIDPELPDELYGKLIAAFFAGIQALAVGWEAPPRRSAAAGRSQAAGE